MDLLREIFTLLSVNSVLYLLTICVYCMIAWAYCVYTGIDRGAVSTFNPSLPLQFLLPRLPFLFPSPISLLPYLAFPLYTGPLNELEGLQSAVSSHSGIRSGISTENKYGGLKSCQKTTGDNHSEFATWP